MNALQKALHDPKKRRQLLIAGVAIGGLLLFVLLRKKKGSEPVTETGASPAVEQVPVEGTGSEGGGGSGSGVSSEQGAAELGQTLQGIQQEVAAGQQSNAEGWASLISALSAGSSTTESNSASETHQSGAAEKPGHSGTPLANATVTNNEPGNPRKGERYKAEPVKKNGAIVGYNHVYAAQKGKPAQKIFVAAKGHQRSPSQPPQVNRQAGNPRSGASFTAGNYKGKRAHIYSHAVKGGVGPKHNIIVL